MGPLFYDCRRGVRVRLVLLSALLSTALLPRMARPGQMLLIGRQGDLTISADDIAQRLGTISYEVLCGIVPRAPRR